MVIIERSQEYLEHHGILKQKWGVRHGPPYPLDYDDHSRAQKKANPKGEIDNYEGHNEKTGSSDTSPTSSSSSSPSSSSSGESTKKVETKVEKKEETRAEESRSSSASSEKIKTEKEKTEKESKERQSLHDRRKEALMAKGLSEEEAENLIQFQNRAMAIAAVGALAVGATVTYGLVNKHNIDSDFVLKGGTNMFRVADSDHAGVQDMFYATTNKDDARKYAGMYAKQLNGELFGRPNGKDVYQKMLSPNSDVRVAGAKTGERIYNELRKNNPEFLKELQRGSGQGVYGYDAFNRHTLMEQKYSSAAKIFYDELQRKGYGGVIDINDAKYSGYNATRPVILFGQGKNINVNSVQKLSKQAIQENFNFAQKKIAAQDFWRDTKARSLTFAEITGGAMAMAGSKYLNTLNMDEMPVPQETNTKKK